MFVIIIIIILNILGDAIKKGDIRLVGGRYLWEGRVEIFLSGDWGTISHDGASHTNAVIACRQLGYNTYGKFYTELSLTMSI